MKIQMIQFIKWWREVNNEENFLYWYNHSDNKYYNPGDEIEVDSSMYLEAIYE